MKIRIKMERVGNGVYHCAYLQKRILGIIPFWYYIPGTISVHKDVCREKAMDYLAQGPISVVEEFEV